jgi:hypothetical protein
MRALSPPLFGALAFSIWFLIAYGSASSVPLPTDRMTDVQGFYPRERGDDRTFAWTHPRAALKLAGIDRRIDWRLTARVFIWRPADVPRPHLRVTADDVVVFDSVVAVDDTPLDVVIPGGAAANGVTQNFRVEPGFVPGPNDTRQLGVALESMTLVPAGRPLPPALAFVGGLAGVLAVGLAVSAFRLRTAGAPSALMFLAAGVQSWLLLRGVAAYESYPTTILITGGALAVGSILIVRTIEAVCGERLGPFARGVAAVSLVACYMKLLVLLHPSAVVSDGVFHAHRFENVLSGRWLFTSVAPGQYAFPYPIALYLLAMPFSWLAPDTLHRVGLLQTVVVLADAAAGVVLSWMIARTTGNAAAGAASAVWYHIVPMTGYVMAWGNLTNAFGQALFVVTLAIVVGLPLDAKRRSSVALVSLVAAVAFMAHPSTFALLASIMAATAALYWWQGGLTLRSSAAALAVATAAAVVAAVILYYGWFIGISWQELNRVGSAAAERLETPSASIGARAAIIPDLVVSYMGWPAILGALAGLWPGRTRLQARMGLMLWTWGTTCLMFLVIGLLTPLDLRHYFAAFPAVAILAALSTSGLLANGGLQRVLAMLLVAAGVWVGVQPWLSIVE